MERKGKPYEGGRNEWKRGSRIRVSVFADWLISLLNLTFTWHVDHLWVIGLREVVGREGGGWILLVIVRAGCMGEEIQLPIPLPTQPTLLHLTHPPSLIPITYLLHWPQPPIFPIQSPNPPRRGDETRRDEAKASKGNRNSGGREERRGGEIWTRDKYLCSKRE